MQRLLCLTTLLVCLQFGCSTAKVNLLPGKDGKNKIITTARKEHEAYSASREKAEEYCKESSRKYVVVTEKSEYLGYDQKTKETMRAVGVGADIFKSLSATSKNNHKTVYYSGDRSSSMDTNEDYRVTMTFECQ